MSEINERKDLAEDLLDSAILEIAGCLKFAIGEDVVRSIRDEVIQELVRLGKE